MKFADIAGTVLAIVEKLAEVVLAKSKHPSISPGQVLAIVREHEDEIAGMVMNVVLAKLADRAAAVPAAFDAAEKRGRARAVNYAQPTTTGDPVRPPDAGARKTVRPPDSKK